MGEVFLVGCDRQLITALILDVTIMPLDVLEFDGVSLHQFVQPFPEFGVLQRSGLDPCLRFQPRCFQPAIQLLMPCST